MACKIYPFVIFWSFASYVLYLCEIWSGASAACQPLCLPKACSLCCWFWHFLSSQMLPPPLLLLLLLLLGNWFFFRLPFTGRLSSFSFFLYTICGNPVSPTEKKFQGAKKNTFFDEPVRIVIVILVQAPLSLSSRIFSSFERAFVDVN